MLDFIRYQNACRAALARLDTLMKLTRWITSDGAGLKRDTGESILAALGLTPVRFARPVAVLPEKMPDWRGNGQILSGKT
ncbi:MAG: hypothetical protein M3O22_01315 [Pseudomonadota bacterium]|nr:hypothetical protein [Pseudomonadota bacterium]